MKHRETKTQRSNTERWINRTILCLFSNRCFSVFAFSYSPFSRYLWSGLSRESVGGSFSLIRIKHPKSDKTIKEQLEGNM